MYAKKNKVNKKSVKFSNICHGRHYDNSKASEKRKFEPFFGMFEQATFTYRTAKQYCYK